LEVDPLVGQVKQAFDLNHRDDLLHGELLARKLTFLIQGLDSSLVEGWGRLEIEHIEEHLIQILFIVKRVFCFEKFVELIDRLIKTLDALILNI
jgi:hypothetical protein